MVRIIVINARSVQWVDFQNCIVSDSRLYAEQVEEGAAWLEDHPWGVRYLSGTNDRAPSNLRGSLDDIAAGGEL